MQENFKKEKIDVMKSSPLQEKVQFEEVDEKDKYKKDKISGFLYSEKDLDSKENYRQNIEIERFISMLSKGILHTSDIIEKDGKYYSRLNYFYLENSDQAKEGEIEAEMFILAYLFSDWDKSAFDKDIQDNIYTKDGNFAHFDYSEAFRENLNHNQFIFKKDENPNNFKDKINLLLDDPILIDRADDFFKRKIESGIKYDSYREIADKKLIEKELFEKITVLENTITNGREDFFSAVINKAKLDLTKNERFDFLSSKTQKDRIEELRNILLGRLEVLKLILLDRKKT